MSEIRIETNPDEGKIQEIGAKSWPIWEKEVSSFPWTYDSSETCLILEGEVIVTPTKGKPVKIERGNLVTFPKGMSCQWDIKKRIKKHYMFE
jgi:uncharacterized cupin superfamily protein